MDLKNSSILITGGTSGIGLELVKQLSEKGATIIVTGRKMEALSQTKKRFPKALTFQSDVSDPDEIRDLYQNVTRQFPELAVKGLERDPPEIKPALVKVLKFLSRILPNPLMNFGH